jgi:shikimate dehydrogenase
MTPPSPQRVGLIGWPVEHSLSPIMHNAAFAELGLNWHYELLPTPLDAVSTQLENLRYAYQGANVTVPHKQRVMKYLDQISNTAARIGAINTISVQDGQLIGHNTDADGFLKALRSTGFAPANRRALILGAGGAARAATAALSEAGCATTLYNRRPERAVEVAANLGGRVHGLPEGIELTDLDLDQFDLLINATPVGMWPRIDACPWPAELPIPASWIIYDLVYNPETTRLLARAQAAGATTIGGLEMLIYQGALAFELWTDRQAPVETMRSVARDTLRGTPS